MEEIKAWAVAEGEGVLSAEPLASVDRTRTENLLEEVLVQSPHLLGEDLKLVGRQTETTGGPLDLLGIDGEGRLVVFELKRGTLTRDAVAQVVDYASYLAELEPEALAAHIGERSGKNGIDRIEDFAAWYQEQHPDNALSDLRYPRMVLVGLGADDRARRMVAFLAESDLDISLLTFHAFRENGRLILTRKVEVEARAPESTGTANRKDANIRKLKERVAALGIESFYYDMAKFFRAELSAYEWPNQGGYSYYLSEVAASGNQTLRAYVSLYVQESRPGKVQLYLQPRAVQATGGLVDARIDDKNLSGTRRRDGSVEVWVGSTAAWEKLIPQLKEICKAIVEGWNKKRDEQSKAELDRAGGEEQESNATPTSASPPD